MGCNQFSSICIMVNENCFASVIAALTQTDSDAWCKPALNMPFTFTRTCTLCKLTVKLRLTQTQTLRVNYPLQLEDETFTYRLLHNNLCSLGCCIVDLLLYCLYVLLHWLRLLHVCLTNKQDIAF